MSDVAKIAQAQALVVPVILQGAKTVEGTDRRELFTENTTTKLVFENGAVLKVKSNLTLGQVVFLHNELNKREVLCKVVEVPTAGGAGTTELEFTALTPGFWEPVAEQPAASAPNPGLAVEELAAPAPIPGVVMEQVGAPAPTPEPVVEQEPAPESAENTLAMMSANTSTVKFSPPREELVPTYEAVPVSPAPESESAPAPEPEPPKEWHAPTGEEIDAALRTMSDTPGPVPAPEATGAAAHPEDGADPNDAKVQQQLAALMARESRLAKYAAAKESQAEKIHRQAASKAAPEGAPAAEGEVEPEIVPVKVPLSELLTTGRNAVIVEIVAGILIVISLVFIWRAMRPMFINDYVPRQAAAAPAKAKTTPASASSASGPAKAGATGSTAAGASSKSAGPAVAKGPDASSAGKAEKVEKAAKPSDAKVAAPAPTPAGKARSPAVATSAPAPTESHPATGNDTIASGEPAAQPKHGKSEVAQPADTIPAKILSQPQPAFPSWAKHLDLDGVVTLDAVIDEKGNLGALKVLSGPRQLQRAAEQAVGLWIFEPAQSAGTPVSSHIVLTVEFQR